MVSNDPQNADEPVHAHGLFSAVSIASDHPKLNGQINTIDGVKKRMASPIKITNPTFALKSVGSFLPQLGHRPADLSTDQPQFEQLTMTLSGFLVKRLPQQR